MTPIFSATFFSCRIRLDLRQKPYLETSFQNFSRSTKLYSDKIKVLDMKRSAREISTSFERNLAITNTDKFCVISQENLDLYQEQVNTNFIAFLHNFIEPLSFFVTMQNLLILERPGNYIPVQR